MTVGTGFKVWRLPAWSSLLLLVALAGCHANKKPPPPPPMVAIALPVKADVEDWDEVVGRFVSIQAVDVRPRVSGYIQTVDFRDGQDVRKGQLLFVIDPRPYQATLDRARAAVARARATLANANLELTRARRMFAGKAASDQEVQGRLVAAQQANADLATARADDESAALNVGFTHVRAAVSGRVSDRRVNPGNLVTADQTVLTTLQTLDPIRFEFQAPESIYLKYVRDGSGGRGAPVEVRLQDEQTYTHRGHIEFIDNQVSPTAGTIRGRAVLPNTGGKLTPGLFGQMRVSGAGRYPALLIPDSAVTQDQDRQIVYTIDRQGKVAEAKVETGPLIGSLRVIHSGLTASDEVIVAGRQKAKPGQMVRVKQTYLNLPKVGAQPTDQPLAAPDASAGIVVGN